MSIAVKLSLRVHFDKLRSLFNFIFMPGLVVLHYIRCDLTTNEGLKVRAAQRRFVRGWYGVAYHSIPFPSCIRSSESGLLTKFVMNFNIKYT